ncbi:hypothetical protein J6X04_00475 [Candidatus Saccharibacteria bacterium]|nr:hypothetical protein [Candidatus Saccharibacteria bacterium]
MSSITNGRGGNHSRPGWKIPNIKHANPTWQFHEWVLLFLKEDGYDNMALAARDFYKIWDDPSINEMEIRGRLFLTGELYGCHGHHNGDIPKKRPSHVVLVKRLSHREPGSGSINRINRLDRDEMCLYTDDGELYFFVKNDLHPCTAEFFSYLKYDEPLNHYVPTEYCAEDVM